MKSLKEALLDRNYEVPSGELEIGWAISRLKPIFEWNWMLGAGVAMIKQDSKKRFNTIVNIIQDIASYLEDSNSPKWDVYLDAPEPDTGLIELIKPKKSGVTKSLKIALPTAMDSRHPIIVVVCDDCRHVPSNMEKIGTIPSPIIDWLKKELKV